jgi:hypothetical protein
MSLGISCHTSADTDPFQSFVSVKKNRLERVNLFWFQDSIFWNMKPCKLEDWWVDSSVSDEPAVSIVRVEGVFYSKDGRSRYLSTKLHCFTSENSIVLLLTALRT